MLSSHELADVIMRLVIANEWRENFQCIAALQSVAQSALVQVYGEESGYAMFSEAWETVTSNYRDGLMTAKIN